MYLFGLSAPYSKAVVPQQGWYIHSEVTWSGKDYWVIDNNTTSEHGWYFDVTGSTVNTNAGIDPSNANQAMTEFVHPGLYWGGASDYDWYVDSDWVIRVWIDSASAGIDSGTAVPDSSTYDNYKDNAFRILLWDANSMPGINISSRTSASSAYPGSYIWMAGGETMLLMSCANSILPTINIGSGFNKFHYFNLTDFYPTTFILSYWQTGALPRYLSVNPSNININNLRMTVIPTGGWKRPGHAGVVGAQAHMSMQFLCPKDKAPAGLAVGDRWPKVRPLEVEIENAYEAYYNNLLANGQIKNPGDVNKTFGDLNGKLNDATKAPTIDSDLNTGALSHMMGILGPLTQMLPWLLAGLFVIVLIRRAVA